MKSVIAIFGIILIAAVYFVHLPSTVQSGDTGELVSAAYARLVAHPPGYPLFVWLQAAFISVIGAGSVFWRAAFGNTLISLATIGLVAWTFWREGWISVGLVALLAFGKIYWRYSELPDVFILNAFFAAAICACYFRERPRWIPFLFFLGLAHHLTLVFLAPVFICAMWSHRRDRVMWISSAAGVLSMCGLYLSMLALNTGAFDSWGELNSVSDVISHVLRRDYGTFQLVPGTETGPLGERLLLLLKENAAVIGAAIGLALLFVRRSFQRREVVLFGSLILYTIVFFGLSGMDLWGFKVEVLGRFFILWTVLAIFLAGSFASGAGVSPRTRSVGSAALVVVALAQLGAFWKLNDFSKKTVVQDYAVRILNELPKDRPGALILTSDTRLYGVRYAQLVLGVRPEVLVIAPNALPFPWYSRKIAAAKDFHFNPSAKIRDGQISVPDDLILPNLAKFAFVTNLPLPPTTVYDVVFEPLGRKVVPGQGAHLETNVEPFTWNPKSLVTPMSDYDVERDLISDSAPYREQTVAAFKASGQNDLARNEARRYSADMPWMFNAQSILCALSPSECRPQHPYVLYYDLPKQ